MMKYNCKRFLSVLLAVCMIFSSIGTYPVYAAEEAGCTCGTENETHASDCALMAEMQEICSCTPADGVHQEGCIFYVEPTEENEPAPVSEDVCTCTAVEGIHQEGCIFYVKPTEENEPALVSEDVCTCTPVEGIHQEGCIFYVKPTEENEPALVSSGDVCTCIPVDGVHQEGCILYVVPVNDTENEISFSAGIYLDANRTQLVQELTSDGSTLQGWTYLSESASAEDRYLGISLSGLSMDSNKQYQLIVEMDPILFINQNSDPSLTRTTVSFTKNSDLQVNTDGKYIVNKYSFSNLTYLIESGTEELIFGLPLCFDMKLWDKQDGSYLGIEEDKPLLRVYLQEKQTDGSFKTIEGQDLKLAEATASGSLPYNHSQLYLYLVGGSTSVTVSQIGPEDALRVVQYHFHSNYYTGGHYAKTVEVKIKMPSCTVNDITYTADYMDFCFLGIDGEGQFHSEYDEEAGILTITGEKFYFSEPKLFEICLTAPSAMKGMEGVFNFTGTISVKENGHTVVENKTLSFKLDNRTEAEIGYRQSDATVDTKFPDAVHYMGTVGLENKSATIDSGPLLIEQIFDSNNTNFVRITTVNILADSVTETIEVTYTMVDAEGNLVEIGGQSEFTTAVANKSGNLTTKELNNLNVTFRLPEVHREYYIKTLKYVLNNIPANTKAYSTGGLQGTGSAGTIWGYALAETIPEVMPQHTTKVSQYTSDGTEGKVWVNNLVSTVRFNDGTKVAYGLYSPKVSSDVVSAGDSVSISGQLQVSNYPYQSNSCMDNIRLGLVLPVGITVNGSAVTATYKDKSSLGVSSVTQRPLDDGNVLHIIAFEQGKTIGYYSETLGTLPTGNVVNFTIQLNSEKTISTQTIKLLESVFVAGVGLENGSSGAWQYYLIQDYYDLNENGSTTDMVGSFKNNITTSVTFNASPAELVITDEVMDEDGNTGPSLTMETFADILKYNLHIECTAGGSASEFFYMIPIAKTSMTSDPVFMEKCQVDLELKEAATVTTSQGTAMKVLYSTTLITGYSDTLSLNDWSETLPEGKTWNDVTVIKVMATENEIVNGSINIISVPLGYAGIDTEYEHMAGYQIQWNSRGYYHYKVGYNSNSGTKSTEGATITLTYTPQDPFYITLTAAKGGTPIGEGAVSSVSFVLPEFYLAQTYSVKQISPSNVTLVDETYDFTKSTSTDANEKFRIKVSVKKSDTDQGSTPISLLKENDIVGSLSGKSAPEFTFSIENADALSDIVTDRRVTLTLIGSNGVIVPVEITIKRELATAEPTHSAIVAGKLYAPFEDDELTEVSCDSAFTAQFVTQYLPANYTAHTIEFEKALSSGTTITMIDWTYPSELRFYQYTMDGNTQMVYLTDFEGMGSSGAYTESQDQNVVMERLLFIVAFPKEGEPQQTNTMKLTKRMTNSTVTEVSDVLTFTTVKDREFSLSSSVNSVRCGNSFTVYYKSECSVTDSRYTNRNLSLVIKPAQNNFPIDSCLTVDGTNYYLNAQGFFIVPLKAVQNGSGDAVVSFDGHLTESISMQISLWASATATGSKPLMGNEVAESVSVSVGANVSPSFKVNSMSDRLLEIEDLSNPLTVNFSKYNTDKVTVELQKKIGADYVTQTTILESVNDKTNADAGQGVFTVSGTSSATIKLSSSTAPGTYRLLFTVSNATETIEVPYNFVVVE